MVAEDIGGNGEITRREKTKMVGEGEGKRERRHGNWKRDAPRDFTTRIPPMMLTPGSRRAPAPLSFLDSKKGVPRAIWSHVIASVPTATVSSGGGKQQRSCRRPCVHVVADESKAGRQALTDERPDLSASESCLPLDACSPPVRHGLSSIHARTCRPLSACVALKMFQSSLPILLTVFLLVFYYMLLVLLSVPRGTRLYTGRNGVKLSARQRLRTK